jgi:predicted mannosyl-3-phosphoglycerate phosphatase (HAD superfamily)
MKNKNNIEGTEWNDLFYEENIEVDEVIEVSESEIVFTTKGGTKFKDFKNYKDIEIIEIGSDVENIESAINKIKNMRDNT